MIVRHFFEPRLVNWALRATGEDAFVTAVLADQPIVETLRVLYERRPAVVAQVPVARRHRASK